MPHGIIASVGHVALIVLVAIISVVAVVARIELSLRLNPLRMDRWWEWPIIFLFVLGASVLVKPGFPRDPLAIAEVAVIAVVLLVLAAAVRRFRRR